LGKETVPTSVRVTFLLVIMATPDAILLGAASRRRNSRACNSCFHNLSRLTKVWTRLLPPREALPPLFFPPNSWSVLLMSLFPLRLGGGVELRVHNIMRMRKGIFVANVLGWLMQIDR
jgi:hypothetical protein